MELKTGRKHSKAAFLVSISPAVVAGSGVFETGSGVFETGSACLAQAGFGDISNHTISKTVNLMLKRGEYFKRSCFVFHSTFIPHAHTLESTFPVWNKSVHVKL